ncbi:hypothetical protein F4859DRAFT_511325 [Xylaria cf. heliscus]|nr:hypothetical protein F4859DRAFT_511325 [Xylaria cf. heliscus]
MNEAVAINQNLEKDARGLDHPLLGAPSESNSAPTLEFLWTHLAKDVQFGPTQCLDNVAEEECITSTDVRPFASPNDEFNSAFELENNPLGPPLFAPERTIKQSVDQVDLLSPSVFASGNSNPGAEALPGYNETRDTASSEPSPTSTRSARRTTSTSPTTSVDQSGVPDIKQHRERNRVAARKCRQKAKRNVAGLQQRERELSQQNKVLHDYVSSLREEILDLKTEILRHSDCNSGIIQNYIANAARRQME